MKVERISDHVLSVDVTPEALGVEFIRAYVVRSEGEAALIETGATSSVPLLRRALEGAGLAGEVKAIIPTHMHLDHGGGVGSALRAFPRAIAYAHPRAVPHLADPSRLWAAASGALGWLAELYGEPEPADRDRLVATEDGMGLKVGDLTLTVVHTPGHASHHQSVFLEGERLLFVGDSAGIYVPEAGFALPTTMPPFRLDLYLESIKKQRNMSPSRAAYTHIGVASNAEALERLEERVVTWFETVKEALASGVESSDEIFQRLLERDGGLAAIERAARGKRLHTLLFDLLMRLSVEGLKLEAERLRGWSPRR